MSYWTCLLGAWWTNGKGLAGAEYRSVGSPVRSQQQPPCLPGRRTAGSPHMALSTSKRTLTKSQEDSPGTLAAWSPDIAVSTAFHAFGHLADPVFAIRCNIIDEVFSAFPFNSCHTVHLLSGCLEVCLVCSQKFNRLWVVCLMVSK